MHLGDHILMLIFGVILPLRTFQSARSGDMQRMSFTRQMKKMMYYGNGGFLWAMAIVTMFMWWVSGRSLVELGLGWGSLPYTFLSWSILIVFTILYAVDLFFEIGSPALRAQSKMHFKAHIGFLPANGTEFVHYLFLAFSAGFCEEVVFRGYFVRYFQWLLGQESILAVALFLCLPALVFGIAHFYQGWKAVIKIVAMAVMFGAFLLLTGSLWPLVLLHALVDVLGGVVSWYLLEETD